ITWFSREVDSCVMMPCGIVILDNEGYVHVSKKDFLRTQETLGTKNVRSIAKISDTCLAVGRSNARIELWHLDGNEPVKITTLRGEEGESFVALAAFDCTKLVSCSDGSYEPL